MERRRKHWGWGYEDEQLSPELAAFASERLGFDHPPDVVAYPGTEAEVRNVLDWAVDAGAAVIPFGGGTSVVGGVEASGCEDYTGVVTIDLKRLKPGGSS